MKTTIDMAHEVYGAHTEWSGAPLDRLEQLVALVRADEREAIEDRVKTLDEPINVRLNVINKAIRARGGTHETVLTLST
jgi:hypothetical protein